MSGAGTISGITVPGSWGAPAGTLGQNGSLVDTNGDPVVPPVSQNTNFPEGLGVGIQGALNALFGGSSGSGSGGGLSFMEEIIIVLVLVGILFVVVGKVI